MVFQTFDTVYTVIHSGKSDMQMPTYLCKNESDGEMYQLFGIDKRFLSESMIVFFHEQLKRQEFTDFQNVFLHEEFMYIAMRYYSAPSLKALLEQKELLEWEERLEIGRKILEAFMLTKMPVYFCCHCLKPENILINEALDVHFFYTLDDVELADGMTKQMYWNALADCFTYLWREELKAESVPKMKEYLAFLRQEENKLDEYIYGSYLELSKTLEKMPREERKKPRRRLFILWDKVKKGIPLVKRIVAYLILFAVMVYLVYTVWDVSQPSGEEMDLIGYIGSLNLKK